MGVKSWCEDILALPQEVWATYAYSREPLRGRVSLAEYRRFYQQAVLCGQTLAQRCGGLSVEELASHLQIQVEYPPMPEGNGMLTFACYTEPNLIQIFSDNASATVELLDAVGMKERFGAEKLSDMLLAHELFHVLQQQETNLFVNQKHITLWKLGRWENRSRLVSLEEVAAMSFAEALLAMPVNPYTFDVLMLLPNAPEEAKKLYCAWMSFGEELRNV